MFTTDGRIAALDLTVLTDDKQFFAHYNPSVTMKRDFFDAHPEIAEVTAPVTAALTNDVIIEMNKQVDVEGRTPPSSRATGWSPRASSPKAEAAIGRISALVRRTVPCIGRG